MTKKILISKLIMDKEFYPRNGVSTMTVYKYSQSLKAGAQFPPIIVTPKDDKYLVIDGWHRTHAYKENNKLKIKAEIRKGMSEKEIFIQSVKANIGHGRSLTGQEKVKAIDRFKKYGIDPIQISEITRIPIDDMEKFVGSRMTHIASGKTIFLKNSTKHLKDADDNVKSTIDGEQKKVNANSQRALCDNFLTFLKNQWFEMDKKDIARKLIKIYKKLDEQI